MTTNTTVRKITTIPRGADLTDAFWCAAIPREVADSPDIWIPKSQCQISAYGLLANSPPERNCVVKLTAPEQILTDKELL